MPLPPFVLSTKFWAVIGTSLWLAYVLVVAFYYPAGGDEPGYFWASRRLAEGSLPVLDYFVITPWATLAPYAAVIRWVSPAWEAARLVSVASIALVVLTAGIISWRAWGAAAGMVAFCLMGFSHFWFSWNIQVNHYPIANAAVVAAYAIVVLGPPSLARSLVLGIVAGWAVNARFPLMVAAVALYGIAVWKAWAAGLGWRRIALTVVMPIMAGGFLVSLPSFLILLKDPDGFFYDYLRFRFEFTDATFMAADSVAQRWRNILQNRLHGLYTLFFSWFGTQTKATYPNLAILGTLALGVVRAAVAGRLRGAFADQRVWVAAAMILAILAAYAFADMVLANHLQPILPFMVMIAVGLLFGGAGDRDVVSRFARLGAAVLVALTIANFMFWTASMVLRRSEPSHGRPITVAQVGCWLERHTPPGAMVMNYNTLPVTVSGRRLPAGYDYAGNIIALFWGRLDQDKAVRHKIFTDRDYLRLLESGDLSYLVLDQEHTYYVIPPVKLEYLPVLEEIGQVVARDYHLVAHTGGPFPYRIMVHNSVVGEVPALPRREGLSVDMKRLLWQQGEGLITAVAADLSRSLGALPADLSASLARVANGSFERRCPEFVSAEAR